MTTPKEASELLVRANPAPDEPWETPLIAAGYLATLEQRSSAMQTIERRDEKTPEPGSGPWRWLAMAAIVVALLATAGFFFFAGGEEAPVATTPSVEEPELVPSTEPEAVVEPEPTTPSTAAASTVPNSEAGAVGVTGLPIFQGQPPAGDYEAVSRDLRIVFTSDGGWRDCTDAYCDWRGGIEIRPAERIHAYGWMEPNARTAEDFRAMFTANPRLVVGDLEPLAPSSPEAQWTGFKFTVAVDINAGSDDCDFVDLSPPDYPCVGFEELTGFFISSDTTGPAARDPLVLHGTTQFHVLTTPNGQSMWAAVLWFPYPGAQDSEYEAMNQQMEELVETIRFVD